MSPSENVMSQYDERVTSSASIVGPAFKFGLVPVANFDSEAVKYVGYGKSAPSVKLCGVKECTLRILPAPGTEKRKTVAMYY